jgi:hemerythrin superfamily protein
MTAPQQLVTSTDVVAFLTEQHEQLKTLMPTVLQSQGPDRLNSFAQVRAVLAAHEALEQEAVHPRAEAEVGQEVVQARLDEEAAAEKAIADLEGLDVDSDDFVTGYTKLCADVVAHAENEEHQEFNKLSGDFTEAQMARINAGAALAEGAVSGNGVEGESFAEMFKYAKTHIDAASQ